MKSAKLQNPTPLMQPGPKYYQEIMKDNYAVIKNKFDASPQDPKKLTKLRNFFIDKYVKKHKQLKKTSIIRPTL